MDAQPGNRRTLVVLCLASAAWAFSFGLGVPLAALWLNDAGLDNKLIGLNTERLLPWHRPGCGVRPGLMPASAAAAWSPAWCSTASRCSSPGERHHRLVWLLRFLCGVGTALCLIPMETQVNHNAPLDQRARDFGFYAYSVALGVGLGPLVGLPLYPRPPPGIRRSAAWRRWWVLLVHVPVLPAGPTQGPRRAGTSEPPLLREPAQPQHGLDPGCSSKAA